MRGTLSIRYPKAIGTYHVKNNGLLLFQYDGNKRLDLIAHLNIDGSIGGMLNQRTEQHWRRILLANLNDDLKGFVA